MLGKGAGLVPDHGSPAARRRRLAGELRRLRLRHGLTGEEVASRLGWSESKVSRIELHRTGVKEPDLRKLLDLYGVGEPRRSELAALAQEAAQRGRIETVPAGSPAEYDAQYHDAEAEARSEWNWEPQVIPGLLQTPGYVRAVMDVWQSMFRAPPWEISRRIEARLRRQRRLTTEPPLELTAVVDESVLRRRYGDQQVMREQLERLLDAATLPNVTLRILPLDGGQPLAIGAFSYLQFPQVHAVPLPDTVTVEHLNGQEYLEAEEETYRYRVAFEHLLRHSLPPAGSRELIASAIRDLWS